MNNKVNFLRGTATEYESSIKDNDTFYYTTDTEKLYLGNKEITGGSVTIDDTLSDTSENPVQNKVINTALNSKANASDLSEHTGNSDIHVTAEEKAAWDGKAELTDIPDKLPADGGNADTVDNKHANEFMQFLGDIRNGSLLDHILSLDKSGFLYCGSANCTDMPVDGSYFMVEVRCYATVREAIATSFSTGAVYTNRYSSSKWSGWKNIADGGNAATANTAGTLATTSSNICLRNLSSGTAEATWNTATGTGNCPVGAWYGKHS